MEESKTTRKRNLLYCGHCSTNLPKLTYYCHRAEYFDEMRQEWVKDSHDWSGDHDDSFHNFLGTSVSTTSMVC